MGRRHDRGVRFPVETGNGEEGEISKECGGKELWGSPRSLTRRLIRLRGGKKEQKLKLTAPGKPRPPSPPRPPTAPRQKKPRT